MAQAKQPGRDKSLASLHKATDTLSTMLAQEVKELNARQKAQRGDGSDPALMKGLKEATAVLKDLAAVAKTLNDQGADAEARARERLTPDDFVRQAKFGTDGTNLILE